MCPISILQRVNKMRRRDEGISKVTPGVGPGRREEGDTKIGPGWPWPPGDGWEPKPHSLQKNAAVLTAVI